MNIMIWYRFIVLTLFLSVNCGCFSQNNIDDEQEDKIIKKYVDSLIDVSTPYWGSRMVIWGDFDGDNKVDTLVEKFTDSTESVEVPKYFDSLDIYDFHKISHK